jgi:hypothetical protein
MRLEFNVTDEPTNNLKCKCDGRQRHAAPAEPSFEGATRLRAVRVHSSRKVVTNTTENTVKRASACCLWE